MTGSEFVRSLSYLAHRYVLRQDYLVASVPERDVRFRFKIEDGGGRTIYKRGTYEPHLTRFVERELTLQSGDVMLDIGANMGWYSVLADRALPEGVTVFAFEPDPLNFKLLTENLKLNNCTKVIPVQMALADASGTMTLYQYESKNTGRHSLLPINEGRAVTVPTARLDDFLTEREIDSDRVKFVKIDVEGYELGVFRGAEALLASGPTILAEYAPEYMRQGGLEPGELFDLLTANGYDFAAVEPDGIETPSREELVSRENNADLCWRAA